MTLTIGIAKLAGTILEWTSAPCGDERDGRGRGLAEGLTDALAGACRVGVAVELADQFSAVLVAEVQRDVAVVQLQDVPRVPAEVVPSCERRR